MCQIVFSEDGYLKISHPTYFPYSATLILLWSEGGSLCFSPWASVGLQLWWEGYYVTSAGRAWELRGHPRGAHWDTPFGNSVTMLWGSLSSPGGATRRCSGWGIHWQATSIGRHVSEWAFNSCCHVALRFEGPSHCGQRQAIFTVPFLNAWPIGSLSLIKWWLFYLLGFELIW